MTLRPHSAPESASAALIGAILLDAARVMPLCVEAGLGVDHFAAQHASLYAACQDLYARQHAIDPASVAAHLTDRDGRQWAALMACYDATATAAHCETHIAQLADAWGQTVAIRAAEHAIRAIEAGADPVETLAAATRRAGEAQHNRAQPDETLYERAVRILGEWERPAAEQRAVLWPVQNMDMLLGRVPNGLIYVCAGPAVGKTALALQLCRRNAEASPPIPGAYACLESSADLLAERLIAAYGRVDTFRLRNNFARRDEWDAADRAVDMLRTFPVVAYDRTATVAQLTAWAEGCVAGGARFVVVDNLKQVQGGDGSGRGEDNQAARFMALSAGMVALRKRLNVPVIVLHHLDEEGRVRWSKELANDADTMLHLSREGADGVCVRCVKMRNGASEAKLSLRFLREFQTFEAMRSGVTAGEMDEQEVDL